MRRLHPTVRGSFGPSVQAGLVALAALCIALIASGILAACGGKLPDRQSPGAQLYVQYCSGRNCHGAIPPQRDVANYWMLQTDRMLALMRERNFPLPNAHDETLIRAYLTQHARSR